MIIYVATFGRSGSTFFRIILNKVFGYSSYAGLASSEDLTTIGAEDLSGYRPFSALVPHWDSNTMLLAELRKLDQQDALYFIKTHSPNPLSSSSDMFSVHDVNDEEQDDFRTIVIVRDGRDTLISFAHYFINLKFTWKTWLSFAGNYPHRISGSQKGHSQLKQESISFLLALTNSVFKLLGMQKMLFRSLLKGLIRDQKWDHYHRRMLARRGKTAVVHFDDLIANPIATVTHALQSLDISLQANSAKEIPTFEELSKLFPEFFNSGRSGRWREEMPEDLQLLFWKSHGETMQKLGYSKL